MDNDLYLQHYGVKGMKWGIRRNIKKRSRFAAQATDYIRRKDYKIESTKQKISTRKAANKPVGRQQDKLYKLQKSRNLVNNYRKQLTKDLSRKDILQGQRFLNGTRTIATTYAGVAGYGLSNAVINANMNIRAKRSTKKRS